MNKALSTRHQVRDEAALPDDVVLRVDNVSKKFCRNLKRSMAYGIHDLGRNLLGLKANDSAGVRVNGERQELGSASSPVAGLSSDALTRADDPSLSHDHSPVIHHPSRGEAAGVRPGEFWALRDISFDLKKGEVLGLIGANGCGKSTMLRLITGIYPPDEGIISMRGRVGALIALGAGFHPHLTGRENIFLNGSIVGLRAKETREKLDEIIDFSEVGDFIDAPVSTYSSGMRVRLGFSVAVMMNVDILLIDEVLAVGDIGFRMKCINRIRKIISNSAVILVGHSMPTITSVASRVMMLDRGRVAVDTEDVALGIQKYYTLFGQDARQVSGDGTIALERVQLSTKGGPCPNNPVIEWGQELAVELSLYSEHPQRRVIVRLAFLNAEMHQVADIDSRSDQFEIVFDGHHLQMKTLIKPILLAAGKYTVCVSVSDPDSSEWVLRVGNAAVFQCAHRITCAGDFLLPAQWVKL